MFSLNELGQMNGSAGGATALSEDEEMPEQHELGEELAFTGRYDRQDVWQSGGHVTLLWQWRGNLNMSAEQMSSTEHLSGRIIFSHFLLSLRLICG